MDRGHIAPLTSLRGIAALYVLFHHLLGFYLKNTGDAIAAHTALVANGYLWVDYFFILSGFLLALLYHEGLQNKTLPLRDFIVRRFARIYPLHLLILFMFLLLQLALYVKGNQDAFSGNYSPVDFLRSLFLVHAIQRDPFFTPWNGPSWSISAEWCAYLLFPWLVLALFRLRGPLMLGVFWLTGFAVLTALASGTPRQLDLTGYLGLIRCITEFSMGIVLCATVHGSRFASRRLAHSSVQIALFAGILLTLHFEGLDVLAVMLMVLTVASVSDRETGFTRALSHPWLFYLGTISYSLYMVHWLVFSVIDKAARLALGIEVRLFETLWQNVGVGLVCTLAVLLVSIASFHWVEEPMRKRIPRLLGLSRRKTEPALSGTGVNGGLNKP